MKSQNLQFSHATGQWLRDEWKEDFSKFLIANEINYELLVLQKQIQSLSRQFFLLAEQDNGWPNFLSELRGCDTVRRLQLADDYG